MTEDELAGVEAEYQQHDVIAPLVAEVRRLRALVEVAYREGFEDRRTDRKGSMTLGDGWVDSDARAALGER